MCSTTTTQLGCGTKSQPWVVEAPIGQQIHVSLLEFGSEIKHAMPEKHISCELYGMIMEKSAGKNVSICKHSQERGRPTLVYKSRLNVIEVVLEVINIDDEDSELSRTIIGFQGNHPHQPTHFIA